MDYGRASARVGVLGGEAFFAARGLRPRAYIDAVASSSDAEQIITPSKRLGRRQLRRADLTERFRRTPDAA